MENEDELIKQDLEPNTRLHTLLHTKQYSRYSLFQHLLLPLWALSFFLFIGFYEKYILLTRILARSVLILYLLVLIVSYLITKKRDVLYMIIAFIIEFPILVFLAYFDQMIALFTLAIIGFFIQMYVGKNPNRSSSLKESKKISQAKKSQSKFSIENKS